MRLCRVDNQCYACRCTNSLVLKMDTLGLRNRKSKYKKTNVVRYDRCVEGGGGAVVIQCGLISCLCLYIKLL